MFRAHNARGGSKGVVNKNIRELNGVPLIGYTINGKKCQHIDRLIVLQIVKQ